MKAHLHFIKYVLAAGHGITVYNGDPDGENECTRSLKYGEIVGHAEAAEDARLSVFNKDGDYLGFAYVLHDGDDDTVADFSATPFMDEWFEKYNKEAA